jgi:hypothetical protein
MSRLAKFSAPIVSAAILMALPSPGWALSLSDKAALQAAMQRYIDQQTVEGVYLHLDRESGEVQKLHPLTPHPMIMRMGENYVLCFDFKDSAGKDVNIDFYLAPKKSSFVVFLATVNDHDLLYRLKKDGKITRAE